MKKQRGLAFFLAIVMIFSSLIIANGEKAGTNTVYLTVNTKAILDNPGDLGFTPILPADKTAFEVPEGTTIFELMQLASKQHSFKLEATDSGYITGIGFANKNTIQTDIGVDMNKAMFGFAGFLYTVNGEFDMLGTQNCVLKQGDVVEFKYSSYSGLDNSTPMGIRNYDFEFLDAYYDLEKLTTDPIDESSYTVEQLNILNERKLSATTLLQEVYNASSEIWISYFESLETTLWGPGSVTENLQKSVRSLRNAINKVPNVESVSLETEQKNLNIKVGETAKYEPTILPQNASKDVSYDILFGGDCFTIDKSGVIKGIKAGSGMVKIASVDDSSKSAMSMVTVENSETTTVSISAKADTIEEGKVLLNETIVTVPFGETVETALKNSFYEQNIPFEIKTGMLTKIGDVSSDEYGYKFMSSTWGGWVYLINGKLATSGINTQTVNENDKIELVFTVTGPNTKTFDMSDLADIKFINALNDLKAELLKTPDQEIQNYVNEIEQTIETAGGRHAYFIDESENEYGMATNLNAITNKFKSLTNSIKYRTTLNAINQKIDLANNFILKDFSFDGNYDENMDWYMMALSKSGATISNDTKIKYINKVLDKVKANQGVFQMITDYERIVMGLSSVGYDCTDIAGYNFIEKLDISATVSNYNEYDLAFAIVSGKQYLTSSKLKTIANGLVAKQKEDGSFGNVDTTAMALYAISLAETPKTLEAVKKGLEFIKLSETTNGGFIHDGEENSCSAAQVAIALCYNNIDIFENYPKLIDNLFKYQLEDGGFYLNKLVTVPVDMATYQSVLALSSIKRMLLAEPQIYDFSDANSDYFKEEFVANKNLLAEILAGTVNNTEEEKSNATAVLNEVNLVNEETATKSQLLTSINKMNSTIAILKSVVSPTEEIFNIISKGNYIVKCANEIAINVKNSDADVLLTYETTFPKVVLKKDIIALEIEAGTTTTDKGIKSVSTVEIDRTIKNKVTQATKDEQYTKIDVVAAVNFDSSNNVYSKNMKLNLSEIFVSGNKYKVVYEDADGNTTILGTTQSSEVISFVTKKGGNFYVYSYESQSGGGGNIPSVKNYYLTVNASKAGITTNISNKKLEYKDGMTPYDALVDLFGESNIETTGRNSSIYVSGIKLPNGKWLREFDKGAKSGWEYSVNGKYPSISCSAYTLKSDDKLVWIFQTQPTSGGGSTVVGGGVDGYTPTTTPKPTTTPTPPPTNANFDDHDLISSWAVDGVYNAKEKNIIVGFDNKFNPKNEITRAEFVTILLRLINKNIESKDSVFKDVSKSDWFNDYVVTAYEQKLVMGDEDGNFKPNDPITREEMAVIICNAFDIPTNENSKESNDFNKVSSWASDSVKVMINSGIILGDQNNNFNPTEKATREMVAVIVSRLEKY